MSTIRTSVSLFLIIATYCQQSSYYPDTTICEYGDVDSNYVTYCDLNNTLRAQILEKFENYTTFVELVAKIIQLEFHDCFGPKEGGQIESICDGCIDYELLEHAGLETGAINKIDDIYTKSDKVGGYNWDLRMSRADFWAATATIILQESTWFNGSASWREVPISMQYPNNELPYIPFYTGRLDCSGTPDTANDTTKAFPNPILGWDYNYGLFNDPISGFDLNTREYICLLGAHGLGHVDMNISGFGVIGGSSWTVDWDVVGNAFYSQLLDDGNRTDRKNEWVQKERLKGDGLYEWVGDPNTERFRMLNSDMALLFNLDDIIDETTGELLTSCTFDTCERNDTRELIIKEFAASNQLWLNEFADVFSKMIRTGYDKSIDPSDLKVLAEDWYYTANGVTVPTFKSECDSVVTYTSDMDSSPADPAVYGAWKRISDSRIENALESTLEAFIADGNYAYCSQNLNFLSYYWGYQYDVNGDDMIEIDTRICCGAEAATFSSIYSPPSGYTLGIGAAFNDMDDGILMVTILLICLYLVFVDYYYVYVLLVVF